MISVYICPPEASFLVDVQRYADNRHSPPATDFIAWVRLINGESGIEGFCQRLARLLGETVCHDVGKGRQEKPVPPADTGRGPEKQEQQQQGVQGT